MATQESLKKMANHKSWHAEAMATLESCHVDTMATQESLKKMASHKSWHAELVRLTNSLQKYMLV